MRQGGSHVLNSFYRVTPLSCGMLLVEITWKPFSLNALFGDWKPSNPCCIFYMHVAFILNDSSMHLYIFLLPFLTYSSLFGDVCQISPVILFG